MMSDSPHLRMVLRLLAGCAVAASLSGCMTAAALYVAQEEKEMERLSQPAPSDYAWAAAPGVAVSGVVRLPTAQTQPFPGGVRNGPREILTCASHRVRLIPDTPHLRYVLEREFDLRVEGGGYWRNGFVNEGWDWPAESAAAIRETTCDADGAFALDNIPDGDWLVMAEIDPPSYDAGITDTDTVLKAVTVQSQGRPVRLDVQLGGNDYLYGPILRKR